MNAQNSAATTGKLVSDSSTFKRESAVAGVFASGASVLGKLTSGNTLDTACLAAYEDSAWRT